MKKNYHRPGPFVQFSIFSTLYTQVTNQLVLACKEYIQRSTINLDTSEDMLWDQVQQEVASRDTQNVIPANAGSGSSDPQHKHFHSQVESRLKVNGLFHNVNSLSLRTQ